MNLVKGDSVAIVVNSNGLYKSKEQEVNQLIDLLNNMGLQVKCSPYLYRKENIFSGNDIEKAEVLMNFYKDNDIKAIFDISGGDLANGVIDLLDYQVIKESNKPLFGYSDLTCLLNALYAQTQQINVLYQMSHLVHDKAVFQQQNFYQSLFKNQSVLYDFSYRFIRGTHMSGIVVGGNIRCFLKLAGTKYFPNMKDKILFLESLGGESALIYSHLIHLKQMGVFDCVAGILLGTFTTMQEKNCQPSIEEMIVQVVERIPIAKTEQIGHGTDSKALIIGQNLTLKEKE